MSGEKSGIKVIIAGGSVAGLTLAHSLSREGIDYVVLEAYKDIAPQVGASIGILPNGARILDQLGCFDDVDALCYPMQTTEICTGDGELISKTDSSQLTAARFNYPIAFLDRQMVLRVLYDHLPDKSKVLVGKKVVSVNQTAKGVIVKCKDGSEFEGDIIAGADGVHSAIRHEMWRHAESRGDGHLFAKDKQALSSEYRCLFGISNPVPGWEPGSSYRAYNEDWTFLVINGKDSRCFWFAYEKLPQRVYGSHVPRFSKEEELRYAEVFKPRHVSKNVTFDQLWDRRITSTLISLDEASYEHWTYDRFVCLGDAIHKMTPNLGQGGNSAMESAAALTNHLHKLKVKLRGAKPSQDQVAQTLKDYETERQWRQNYICDVANNFTRTEAFATPKHKIMAKYVAPMMGDFLADQSGDSIIGAIRLEYLPLPKRSLKGTLGFDPNAGVGHKESRAVRALYALPLLGLAAGASFCLNTSLGLSRPYIGNYFMTRSLTINGVTAPLWTGPFYRIPWLDGRISRLLACFTPSIANMDHAQQQQVLGFMADFTPLQIIWMIESARRGNTMTVATLHTFFALAYQLKGIGIIGPLYYFLQYVQSPQENYAAADNRMVPVSFAKTIIPAVAIGYVLPNFAMFLPFSISTRQNINAVWQLFPIWTAVLQKLLIKTQPDTSRTDRLKRTEADMPYLRQAYLFGGAVSGLTYLYLWTTSPFSMKDIFFSGLANPTAPVSSMVEGFGRFLKYDQVFSMGSGLLWELLHFKDLKKKGKTNVGWGKLIGVLGGTTLVFGPGAAMAVGWLWREEIMAKRKAVEA